MDSFTWSVYVSRGIQSSNLKSLEYTMLLDIRVGAITEQNMLYKEKAMAPHSSTLAWKIPWMEELGRLQSMGSLRVGHN